MWRHYYSQRLFSRMFNKHDTIKVRQSSPKISKKPKQTIKQVQMKCPTILFVSPKRGGILQSSGFLDLPSLMALSETCKSNALDALSLIQLIENEIMRYHGSVQTMEEAIVVWRQVCAYGPYGRLASPLLKEWLDRYNGGDGNSVIVT